MVYDTNKFAPMWIKHETKKQINDMKVHPNQSYDEAVQAILEKAALYDKYCLLMGNDCMVDDGR